MEFALVIAGFVLVVAGAYLQLRRMLPFNRRRFSVRYSVKGKFVGGAVWAESSATEAQIQSAFRWQLAGLCIAMAGGVLSLVAALVG